MRKKIDRALIINEIIRHYRFKNNSEFAEFLGIKPQTLSTWKARNTFNVELILQKCEDISQSWLLTGEGEMLKNNSDKNVLIDQGGEKITKFNPSEQGLQKINLTGVEAKEVRLNSGLDVNDFSVAVGISPNTVYNNEKADYVSDEYHVKLKKYINQKDTKGGKTIPLYEVISTNNRMNNSQQVYGYMNIPTITESGEVSVFVHADFLAPTYPAGSVVILKEVKRFRKIFQPNLPYYIETEEQNFLYYLKNDKDDPDYFIAYPEDESRFDSFPIPKDEVIRLWKVMGGAKRTAQR